VSEIGQGRDNARLYLEQHPEMLTWVEAQILEKHSIKRGPQAAGADSPEEKVLSDKRPRAKA
jgi:recombination protein RecA